MHPASLAQESETLDAAATAGKLGEMAASARTDLVARLSDEQIRDLLLFYLGGAPIDAAEAVNPLLGIFEQKGETIRENALRAVAAIDDIPEAFGTAYGKLAGSDGLPGVVVVALSLAFLVAAGWAAERLYSAGISGVRASVRTRAADPGDGVLLPALAILALDAAGIALFAFGYAAAFLTLWQGNVERRQLAIALLLGILAVRLTRVIADFLFSPDTDGSRIVPLDRTGAQSLRESFVRIAVVGAVVLLAGYLIGSWSGNRNVRLLLAGAAGAVFVATLAASTWRNRHLITGALLASGEAGSEAGWGSRLFATSWPILIIVYAGALYLAMLVAALADAPVSVASFLAALLLIVVAVPAGNSIVELFLSRRGPGTVEGPPRRLDPRVLRRVARIVIATVALLILLRLFGVDLIAAANETAGAWAARLILDVGLAVLVAYILWEFAAAAIDRKLAAERAAAVAHGGLHAAQASRLTTLLPLFRRALQGAIMAVAALMVLSALGVDIAPLLAGAGIFGLAVGFGAQTLVKDIISGLFFLLDDAFRVGEYIQVGAAGGAVERINTRSLTLRTPDGALHTVPFGDIQAVANYSRDWAVVKMEFKVAYETDLGKVKKIFRRIGEELLQDPELAPGFLQPFQFQDVKAIEETGILVRGKFMAVPGTQFHIRRKVFERVQRYFDAEGILFTQRRVQLEMT